MQISFWSIVLASFIGSFIAYALLAGIIIAVVVKKKIKL